MKTLRYLPARLVFATALLLLTLGSWTAALGQITPSDDGYVNSALPTTNYGAATTLNLQSAAETSYIRFDLSAVPAGYTGASITKATLKLYVNSVTTAGSFNVDYVNGSWTENKIIYNLQPALGTTIAASVPLTSASKGKYMEIDITAAMVEWLNNTQPNDGIALVANSPLVATFDSKENTGASHPPEIDIVYAGIAGVTTANGSGLTGGGTSGTLDLGLTNACSAKQVLQWNGSAWACAAVGTGTISGVTAGTDLIGGGTSGNVTLNLDTTKVPQLAASNNFIGNQGVTGNVTASGTVSGGAFTGNGSSLTNVNAAELGGLPAGSFATLSGYNFFTTQQNFSGNGVYMYVGDPGCGSGFAAIGFGIWGLYGCSSYSMVGDGTNTYINRPTGGAIHFREGGNGSEQMTLFAGGGAEITAATGTSVAPSQFPTALWVENDTTSSNQSTLVLWAPNVVPGAPSSGVCWFDVNGNFYCRGSKSAVVPVDGGSRNVALYAVESPENWFEDYGGGTLVSGSATVTLDPVFAQTVNTGTSYRVFVTPKGDCRGLYVTNETGSSFEVHELGGGHSNIEFDYRIIAKRKGYENIRMADKTEAIAAMKQHAQKREVAAKTVSAKKP